MGRALGVAFTFSTFVVRLGAGGAHRGVSVSVRRTGGVLGARLGPRGHLGLSLGRRWRRRGLRVLVSHGACRSPTTQYPRPPRRGPPRRPTEIRPASAPAPSAPPSSTAGCPRPAR